MTGVETLLILTVTSLYIAVMTRRIWFDKFMLNAHAGCSSLKKCGAGFHRLREPVCKFKAIVSLNTFDVKSVFFEERRGILQKTCR